MHLIIDQGNSYTKVALFEGAHIREFFRFDDLQLSAYFSELSNSIDAAFVSTVRASVGDSIELIKSKLQVTLFDRSMRLPMAFDYKTFDTLGLDRIANACAVHFLYPQQNCLIVDAGTCVTYSVIKNGTFVGGAISPGLQMRFKSLHHFTGRLPLLSAVDEAYHTTGKSTSESILSGVEIGIVKEIDGMIDSFCSENGPLNVILTGGDGSYLGSRLKSPIFANENLTLEGLNQIYLYQLT